MAFLELNNSELLAILGTLQAKAASVPAKITPVIAEMLVASVHDVYDAEGPGWKDLAESTQQARRGTSYKILNDTGVMENSTAPAHGADWAEAYGGASYTIFHVKGTKYMPRRDPFELGQFGDDVQKDVADLLLREVTT